MVDTGGVIGGVGEVVQGGAAIASATMNSKQNQENLRLQKAQFKYQKQLQSTLFAREDNAVQRRATDLQKAGFNRVLAAGSGAQAGPVVSTTAPQEAPFPDLSGAAGSISDAAQVYMNMITQKEQIAKTVAERKFIELQQTKSDAESSLARAQAAIKWHDYGIYNKYGITSNAGSSSKNLAEWLEIADKATKGKPINLLPPGYTVPESSKVHNIKGLKDSIQKK